MNTIALVDDDPIFREGAALALREAGFPVTECSSGRTLTEAISIESLSLIVLDVMMPDENGIEICHQLRTRGHRTPIILMSAHRREESDRVSGLDWGADDYLVKPFGMRELIARINACLRRCAVEPLRMVSRTFGSIGINVATRTVTREGQGVDLTAIEFSILEYLARRSPDFVAREELLSEVWKFSPGAYTRAMDTHILHLRQKLEADPKKPRHLLAKRGAGYSLV